MTYPLHCDDTESLRVFLTRKAGRWFFGNHIRLRTVGHIPFQDDLRGKGFGRDTTWDNQLFLPSPLFYPVKLSWTGWVRSIACANPSPAFFITKESTTPIK